MDYNPMKNSIRDFDEEVAMRPRNRTIGGNMTRIADTLETLNEQIAKLHDTLAPILSKDDSIKTGSNMGEDAPETWNDQSELSEQLEAFADKIQSRVNHIRRILDRVNL